MRACVLAAALAGLAAESAVAHATPEATEPGELTFAEGVAEGEKVRIVAGEVDGRGLLYAEYYTGPALRFAVPYTRAFVDGEETSIRTLRALEVAPVQTVDGFAFTALQGTARLQCTALMWSDATATCTRDPAWTPPGAPACAATFKSHTQRFQCNGLRAHFASPAIDHDELLRACVGAFRWESHRTDCLRYGYNLPDVFGDVLEACHAAYRTEQERNFCMYYSLAPARPEDRVRPATVRACDRQADDDVATTACVFRMATGGRPDDPRRPPPKRRGTVDPSAAPTAPVQLATVPGARVRGARIDIRTGTRAGLTLRATGGMVGTEPVLWVDGLTGAGELTWMNLIDRIVVGHEVRALREVSALDRVKLAGEMLTFRATHAGRRLSCRASAGATFARCR